MPSIMGLQKALQERNDAITEFYSLCEEAKISPVSSREFAKNIVRYKNANDKIYEEMLNAQLDKGAQVLYTKGGVSDLRPLNKSK